ncbi:hypothetical protein GDO81_001061 [Engystomops pustulosus]|uniref:Uncharacterized protein n=1 Tax=Engystomops pustulosus TaxID=76066 RepID=A0AAV7DBL0_ENGPU|nr:hypothetical protein GDO81_001061 [Engystomops pustulosus]
MERVCTIYYIYITVDVIMSCMHYRLNPGPEYLWSCWSSKPRPTQSRLRWCSRSANDNPALHTQTHTLVAYALHTHIHTLHSHTIVHFYCQ